MDKSTTLRATEALTNALRPIQPYLDDPAVQEIEINGERDVWIERNGAHMKVECPISDSQIRAAIMLLARLDNKDAKGGTPDGLIDARLDGLRVAAALPPTSVRGPSICIRKHGTLNLTLDDYVCAGAIPLEWADRLRQMIHGHENILIAGGTSSGKTTFTNALIGEIDPAERVLTIEDTPELKVKAPNWVGLESNQQAGIATSDLVRLSLRYRPDRIIVGEVRGAEAYDLLDAANTGHDGVIATLHANSAKDALARFGMLILRAGVNWSHRAICSQIASTFHYVVFMRRINGLRMMAEVVEIEDYNDDSGKYLVKQLFDLSSQPKEATS